MIETLHNVTSSSKLSHGHFSANITKFSEQLSLTPFSNCIINEHIVSGSLNLNIPLPPTYYRELWDYRNTDPICIQRAILLVNWNDAFSKKTADEKVRSQQHPIKYI